MFDSWSRLFAKLGRKAGARKNLAYKKYRRRPPRIETLDPRLMMAADVWTSRDDGPECHSGRVSFLASVLLK